MCARCGTDCDETGARRCDFCGETRGLFARRGIQCCAVCHAGRREVRGRYVWGPEVPGKAVPS